MNQLAKQAPTAGLPAHERVYRELRAQVLFGEMPPGAPVTIQGLVASLGAGMTPVREAIRRLIAEGALRFQGNRRVSVPVLDKDAVQELIHARVAIEPELTRRACGHVSGAQVDTLRSIDDRLDRAIAGGDVQGYLEQNYRFHAALYSMANAPILQDMAEGLWLRFGPSLRVVCGRFGTQSLPDQHKAILAALSARDADTAARAMEDDVRQGMEQIVQSLE
ncbi:GntR family transcriptional regulator [Primorskyibacter aestuariivivens]|uniref:GntR family transcriptional regulator n=1 Tax=Primorskyibacter aestuariivivens TaxID=1888912 RepID=UPI002300A0C7|nr:GntR family transcriptional regulator [Primorskyibacter aestuariivivens]MDA7427774.1 GntR family transcriptional regulator [Primorskyibacter aestuariivivens]